MPSRKVVWSHVFHTRGTAPVFVEVGVGDGQRGVASFFWKRADHTDEEWDTVLPEADTMQFDLGRGDRVSFSVLSCVVLVKRVNPHSKRMSVDVRVHQKDRPQEAATVVLREPNEAGKPIRMFSFRVTFRKGRAQ